jgi:hypothetical protein
MERTVPSRQVWRASWLMKVELGRLAAVATCATSAPGWCVIEPLQAMLTIASGPMISTTRKR